MNDQDIDKYFDDKHGFGEHKKIAIKLLKKTIKILNKNNVNYFLISGTLLGYARHNDFIPWDDDIDLIVDRESFMKIDPNIKEKYIKKYKLNFITIGDHMTKVSFVDKGVDLSNRFINCKNKREKYHWPFIDLFMYDYDEEKKNILFFKKQWNVESFFPAKNIYFNGMSAFIPFDSDYFLKINYGINYMNVLVSNHYCHKKEENICDEKKHISMSEYLNWKNNKS